MKLEETITGVNMILNGECDHIAEHHFLYKAGIDEVIASYEKEVK